ncbi:MAG: coenzyme F420-0:L-glutamate ligase [Nitrososphaerota archaeon]|nr:coenzyme F420-0:L-glutamate ligase [Nitrososphaerales archaeon]MCX8192023.1 coenzyme F420-0:L-glutamate ligase [Nitrososphaerales archaeon]MDW8044692.1 coenzyme F420-0:L-glutamate ligase [Nitrososphaerota archaeon]
MSLDEDRSDLRIIHVIGVKDIPLIKPGDDLGLLICEAARSQGTPLMNGDVVVVSQKIVSKAEGRIVSLKSVKPRDFAYKVAKLTKKPPQYIELALQEARSLIRVMKNHFITETKLGWIYPYSGVDLSNVSNMDEATLLPIDPDHSAHKIRMRIKELTNCDVAVIISDTTGRPFRRGYVNVAIGISGISPILDLRGKNDIFGRRLRVKMIAIADELASAAELIMGNADERIPVAIVRGYRYQIDEGASARLIQRPKEKDLFIGSWVQVEGLEHKVKPS